MVTTNAGPEAAGSSRDLRYRPYLDGMRAVAVYLVVGFHTGLGLLSGGFIGVDVFFVLSGFLVTRILVRDLASTGGIRWRLFYSRRVRRILPAALVTLVGTAFAYAIVASPVEMLDALGGFRAAFFYVANWFFIHQATNYFAANVNANPVLHFWSLAVEEQFYLLWPLLLGALYVIAGRAGRRRWWLLRSAVGAAAIASAIQALHLGATNLERAYYGTDTRAYQLLAGAALALTPQLLHLGSGGRRLAGPTALATLAALAVLATDAFGMSPITRGVFVAALASILIVALENARGGIALRVLSSGPLTYFGRISYGIYLWHWPVIILAAHGRSPSPVELFALATPAATALAALSYHLVEHPIRLSRVLDRYKTPVIAIGFATSILVGIVAMPVILDTDRASVSAAPGSPSAPRLLDWKRAFFDRGPPRFYDCFAKPVRECTAVRGTGHHILLVGDSVAQMWIPTFTEIAKRESLTFSAAVYPGCPWPRGLQFATGLAVRRACRAHQEDWYTRIIPQLDPDVIILAEHGYDDPVRPNRFITADGRLVTIAMPGFEKALTDASAATLRSLHEPGRRIVIIEPVPAAKDNPLVCLSKDTAAAKCAFEATKEPSPFERFFRGVADSESDVSTVGLDRVVCPHLPTCDAIVHDIIVWRDEAHLTATFARSIAPQVDAVLRKQGILAAR